MATTIVQFRVEESLKDEATELFESLGLDLPTAFRMFLKKCIAKRGIPFGVRIVASDKIIQKAQKSLRNCQAAAEMAGVADMSIDEISKEISLYRAEK